MLGNDGNFYGTTFGSFSNSGTVFKISPAGTLTTLYSFTGGADGGQPAAVLVQASDGNFYGTTAGTFSPRQQFIGHGTVFRISPTGDYTTLHSFADNQKDGGEPIGGLVQGSDSNFYGTTFGGGKYKGGTVFKLAIGGGSGGGCTYTLSATSVTLSSKGGSKNVSLKVEGADCSWTAVSNDPFITITAGSSGTGNGKVDYIVPGNTNTTALFGTMTIAGRTFTVNQAAGGCTYRLSPKAGKIKSTGGSASVRVTPNFADCDWTAISNDSFITITGGASFGGKGRIVYTVAANTNTTAVTGSITIGGQTFAVTQAGAK